jgi:hypothetical protein
MLNENFRLWRNMTRTKIIASSLLVAVVGGYSWLWYASATRIANEIEQDILLSQEPASNAIFSCEKIEKGGFPFAITISVVNPNCTLRGVGNEIVTIPLQGKIQQTYTLLSTLKKIEIEGRVDADLAKLTGAKELLSLEGKCSLEAGNKGFVSAVMKHPIRLMQGRISRADFEDVKFTLSDFKASTEQEGAKYDFLQTKNVSLFYKKTDTKQMIDVAIDGALDLRYLPYVKEEALREIAMQNSPVSCQLEAVVELPDEKTLVSLGQNPFQLIATRIPHFSIDIKKCEVSSPCTSYTHKASFSIDEDEKSVVHVQGMSDSLSNYTAEFYPFMKSYLIEAIKELNPNGDNQKLQSLVGENKETLFAMIPRLDLLGTIKSGGKLDVTFCKKDATTTAKLQNVGLECAHWGLWMNLNAQSKSDAKEFMVSIDLLKYRSLVQDVVAYCNRAFSLYNLLKQDEDQALTQVTEATQQKIEEFLRSLSSQPGDTQAENVQIQVNIAGDKKSVGKMDMQAFTVKIDELVKTLLKNIYPETEVKKEEALQKSQK